MEDALSQFDLGRLYQIIRLGCDRATACKDVGITVDELETAVQRDDQLRRKVLQAEANPEVHHMGNVFKAAKEEKNWRSSVWWIERRDAQQESDGDSPEWSTPAAVCAALQRLAELIATEIPDLDHRRAVLTRLLEVAADGAIRASSAASTDVTVTPQAETAP